MGVEAGPAWRSGARRTASEPDALWFATVDPAYLDKTNATAIHAALRLDRPTPALDFGGAVRSAVGALRAALAGRRHRARRDAPTSAPACRAAPTRPTAATAPPRCSSATTPTAAGDRRVPRRRRRPPRSSSTAGATPGDAALEAVGGAVRRDRSTCRSASRRGTRRSKAAELDADQVDHVVVTGLHARAVRSLAAQARRRQGDASSTTSPRTVGNTGAAQAGLLLADVLEAAEPGQVIARASSLADGADVLVFRTTDAIAVVHAGAHGRRAGRERRRRSPTASSSPGGATLTVEPPAPARARPHLGRGAPRRTRDWKYGFVGSRDRVDRRAAPAAGPRLAWRRRRRRHGAGADGRRAGHDRHVHDRPLAYSPSPPIVFAVVDFDGGGRLPVELTDVDADDAADRRPGRDDVPPAVHRRRHPQLLLEGPSGPQRLAPHVHDGGSTHGHRTASRTRSPSSGWAAPTSASTGTRAPTTCSSTRPQRGVRRRPASTRTTSTRTGSAPRCRACRAWPLARPLQLQNKPVTHVENFCATGSRGAAQRRLRRGVAAPTTSRWRSASRR